MAEAVDMDASQVRRYLNLTLLSPAMTGRVLTGDEPDDASLESLSRNVAIGW